MLRQTTAQAIRQTVGRHVRSSAAPKLAFNTRCQRLISSTSAYYATFNPQNFPLAAGSESDVRLTEHTEEDNDSPWFLRSDESSSLATPIFKAEMPIIPENSPAFVEPLMQSLIDLGLDEIKVFDLRGREEEIPIAQHTDFAVVCQGKSPKHIQNAAEALVTQLKKDYDVLPFAEGLVKPNSTIRMKRKLKQKKPVNDFGLGINSWVMLDSQMGLVINMLTPERHKQVNLEYIWCKPEERSHYEPKTHMGLADDDSIFAGIFRRHYSTAPDDVPLEVKAVQCFQIRDIKTFEAEIVPQIRNSPDRALSVLDTLITELKNFDVDSLVSDDAQAKARLIFSFVNSCAPADPTREHWNKRFEALEVVTTIFPMDITCRHMTTTLLLQASSGIPITTGQLLMLAEALAGNFYYNPPFRVLDQEQINRSARGKLGEFTMALEACTAEYRGSLPDDVLLGVLKLATQQHLYLRLDEIIPVSVVFDVLLAVFGEREPSVPIIEFALITYLKSNQVDKFWAFWNGLYKYEVDQSTGTAVLDQRPWSMLCELLAEHEHEKLVDELINVQIRDALVLGMPLSQDMKTNLLTILDRYDKTGDAYKGLRERIA